MTVRRVRFTLPFLAAGLASCGEAVDPQPVEQAAEWRSTATEGEDKRIEEVSLRPIVEPADMRRPPAVAPEPKRDPDDAHREKVVGVWRQSYTGVRWLRVEPDGTAVMFIDPDWVARAIIGERLTVQIEWTIDDGRALMKSVSGEPESAFKAVNRLFGAERNRLIAELTDLKFVLLDEEDGSRSEWTRVDSDESLPPELTVRPSSFQR